MAVGNRMITVVLFLVCSPMIHGRPQNLEEVLRELEILKELEILSDMSKEDLLAKFQDVLERRSIHAIKSIGRTFRIWDDDGNKVLNLEEFKEGLKDYGNNISPEVSTGMFHVIDRDASGDLSFDEFLVGARGKLNADRLAIVKEAFKKADRNGDGVFTSADLAGVYDITKHPKYLNGGWTKEQVYQEFLNSFEPAEENRDGRVTEQEFIDYYKGVSANIDNDAYFNLMIRNAWKI